MFVYSNIMVCYMVLLSIDSVLLFADDFFAEWLDADNCDVKHIVASVCFLSRQGHKTRRVKKTMENYMFVIENGVDFAVDQFTSLL
jgi:hypothetical protein